MEHVTPPQQPHTRGSFSLAHLAIVAVLALGAGAGTAWLLTDGGSTRTATRSTLAEPAQRTLPGPAPVAAPILATPEAAAINQPAPVARREVAGAPAAAPMPVMQPRGSSGSSSPKLNYGDDERALAPAGPAPAKQPGAARVGDCERFTTELVVDGRRVTRTGNACLQTDGTWRIQGEN